jgi:Fe(3+) dicitrate transport protein
MASLRPLVILLGLLLCQPLTADSGNEPPQRPAVNIALEENLLLLARLDRMNVVGSAERARQIPGSADYLGPEELEKFEYSDIHRILRQVPGVYLVDEEGYGLRPNIGIRGSGTDRNNRIAVMEDGVLIAPAPYAAPAAYYFPTAARMSAVEVRKGSASIRSGPRTTGGAINLISTPVPETFGGRVNLAFGKDATLLGHAFVGGASETLGFLAETVQQRTDGFKRLDGGGDTGYTLRDYLIKLRIGTPDDATRYQSLELKLGRTAQDSDETYMGLTDADFRAHPNRRYAGSQLDNITTDHELVQLRHEIVLGADLDLTTVVYRTDFSRNWFKTEQVGGQSLANILRNPAQFAQQYRWILGADSPDDAFQLRNNNRAYYAQGVQSVLGWTLDLGAAEHALEFGIRYHRDAEDRLQDQDGYRMQGGRLIRTLDRPVGSHENRVGRARTWSAYLVDEIVLGDWRLTPGLRYERVRLTRIDYSLQDPARTQGPTRIIESTVDAWIPGVGAIREFDGGWQLFGGVHRGYSPPGPGSSARPERSINFELGARYDRGALSAEAVLFANDYSNLVGTCTASTGGGCNIGDQFDGGEAEVRGLELVAGYALRDLGGSGLSLPLRASYTWTDARFRSSFQSSFGEWGAVTSGDALPYLPPHLFSLGLGLDAERWRLDLNANHVDEMRTVAGRGRPDPLFRTDDFWVLDLAGAWQLSDSAELFARIDNLLDETYVVSRRPAGVRPGKPRSYLLGVKVGF